MNKFTGFFIFATSFLFAQQKMTLNDCEDAFRKNNLQLLAEQYNMSQAEADVVQAKIWNLPEVGVSANLVNPDKPSFFNVGPTKSAQISQLFLLGGKRKKQVDFAKSNKELAQLQYNQLVVDLRSQLRETFYSIYFDQRKIQSIDNQLSYLNDLLKAYRVQTAKGNISLKDEVRLNSIVIGLKSDKIQLQNEIVSEQNTLKILTGIPESIEPELLASEVNSKLENQPMMEVGELVNKGLENNAEYLYAVKSIENSAKYLDWQKSLNTPDITGGLQWNQNSGIYHNEVNFMVGIPIPLWKQNQGNVEKAKLMSEQNQKTAEFKKLNLESQITSAYQTWQNQYNLLKSIPQNDMDNLDTVYKGMTENFRRGNVTLIEFTDFIDSYKQSVLQVNEIKKQLLISAEELNRLTQTQIF